MSVKLPPGLRASIVQVAAANAAIISPIGKSKSTRAASRALCTRQ